MKQTKFIHLNFVDSIRMEELLMFDNDSYSLQQFTTRWSLSQKFDKLKITFVPSPQRIHIEWVCMCAGIRVLFCLFLSTTGYILVVRVCVHVCALTLTTSRPNSWKEEEQKKRESHRIISSDEKKIWYRSTNSSETYRHTYCEARDWVSEWNVCTHPEWKVAIEKNFYFVFHCVKLHRTIAKRASMHSYVKCFIC